MGTVLITGANRGIGLALARAYAARGDRVIGTARSPEAAGELATVAERVMRLDVTDTQSIASLAAELAGQPIDIVVANAGMMGPRGGMSDPANTSAIWAEVFATNVTGVFFAVRALAPNVIAARGKVAIISSRMGSSQRAGGSGYLYRSSKAAASNLAANFAVEFGPQGVAVAAYHPGWVRTDMGGSAADIPADTSAKGLVECIDRLSVNTSGAFEDYAGTAITF